MSATIDERVVEMRFDNKQFESGAKETMGTLSKLKQALNLSSSKKSIEGLDKAVQKVSFDGMARGIEMLERRFSTMGIVGMRVVENLTDSVMRQVGKAASFVEQSVVSGGVRRAMNIENAHFQLQALLKDEEKVQAVMDDAMDAVDGTAYGFDEAARAASQFAASGLQAGEDMQLALKGITGVAAMTNRDFSEIATIFTTVAGNGRLMGDQLLQLSDRGMNAASTLKDYFVEVKGLTNTTESDIREMVSKGKLDFKTFADAMGWAFGDSAKRANETFNGSLANMKAALARIGAGFVSPLIEQNGQIIKLFNAMKDRINDVKTALVFDESIGNTEALSNQFTTSVLSMAKVATDFISNADLSKPLQVFYLNLESIKNVAKGVGSVLKPLGHAFKNVFGLPTIDDIVTVAEKIEELTSKMKLSSKENNNLLATFEGIFNIVHLVTDGVGKMIQAFLPVGKPIRSISDQILSLTGSVGRMLTAFTKWVRKSPEIAKAYEKISGGIQNLMNFISYGISNIDRFTKAALSLPEVQSFLSGIANIFHELGTVSAPYINYIVRKIYDFKDSVHNIVPEVVNNMLTEFLDLLEKIGAYLNTVDLSAPIGWFEKFTESVKGTLSSLSGNEGLSNYLSNMRDFFNGLANGFSFSNVTDKISSFKKTIGGFITWIRENLGPLFSNVSFGGIVSGGTGIAMVYSIIKMAKALEGATKSISAFPNTFKKVGNALETYQKKLDSESLRNIAIAIGIVSASLIALSFTDMDKLTYVALLLTTISGILLAAINRFKELQDNVTTIPGVLNTLAKGLGKAIKQFGKARKWKAIGGTFKSFGIAIALIATSIFALTKLNKTDPKSLQFALKIVAIIGSVMTGIMLVMSLVGQKMGKGMKGFKAAADGMRSLSLAMGIVILSLSKLMKMDIPGDYDKRLAIFAGLFTGMGVLAFSLSKASGSTGKKTKVSATTILALSGLLYSMVSVLGKLFKMDLPNDWKTKVGILTGIFGGLSILIIALGKAVGESGKIKAAGTLIALAFDIAVIVGALMILSIMPGEALTKGAIALGAVLLSLSKTLKSMSGIQPETYKTVLAMAIMVGSIVAALGILSMVSPEGLIKGGAALGAMLLALAIDLVAAGKISSEGSWKTVAALAAETAIIAMSLYFLADKPWESLLAAAVALGGVLLSIAGTMTMIGKMETPSVEKMGAFLIGVLSVIPIAYAINELADKPWSGMLAGSASIAGVLVSIGGVMTLISSMPKPDLGKMGMFLLGVAAVIPIAYAINKLADNPWESLLAAGTSIAEVLLSMGVILSICSKIGVAGTKALIGIGILDLLIVDLVGIFTAIGALMEELNFMGSLENGVKVMGLVGDAIGSFVGGIVNGFIGKATESFEEVGTRLSNFMKNVQPFLDGIANINQTALDNGKLFLESLTTMCSSISSLWTFFQTVPLDQFNEKMSELATGIVAFASDISGIDPNNVEGAKAASEVLANLASAVPSQGGLSGIIFGNQDLGNFGEQMKQLGIGLEAFVEHTNGITKDSVSGAVSAAELFAKLSEDIPPSGANLVSSIVGYKDLGKFGEQLLSLGIALHWFTIWTSGITDKSVEGAAAATEIMTELAETVPNQGGLISFFTGDNRLDQFGAGLVAFAQALKQFSDESKKIDIPSIENVTEAVDGLVDLSKKVTGNQTGSLSSFVQSMGSLGNSGINDLSNAFTNGGDAVVRAANGVIAKVIKAMTLKAKGFRNVGSELAKNLISGIKSKEMDAGRAGSDLASKIQNACDNLIDKLYDIGKYAALGFVRGIRSKISDAARAGADIAEAASDASKKKLNEHSPSKVMFQIGSFGGLGFVNGFMAYASRAMDAGKTIGSSAIQGVDQSIENAKIDLNDIFSDPVITPVVDSSRIYAAAGDINKLLNSSVSFQMGRLSNVSMFSNENRMTELIDAVNRLSSKNESEVKNVYTIGSLSYQEGSNVGDAFKSLVQAIRLEGRA